MLPPSSHSLAVRFGDLRVGSLDGGALELRELCLRLE
jgi:hypothetical protein